MLELQLNISRNGADFYSVDLFPDQTLQYSLDFYDSLSIDKIKMPFYTKLKLPLTTLNQGVNRLNFTPTTDNGAQFPRDDFHFELEIFGNSKSTIRGILNVLSVEYNSNEPYVEIELKDQIAFYLTKIKDVNLSELYTQTTNTTNYTLTNFFNNLAGLSGGQKGQIGVAPSSTQDIIFPYVDMANEIEKFRYPQRQFLEYGVGGARTGMVPAFSVQKFLEYLGDYLSTANFPVRVDSALFDVGNATIYDANFQPEKLRFINDAHILADTSAANNRTLTINQALAWVGTNTSMEYIDGRDGTNKEFATRYWGNMEISGNAGGVSSPVWEQRNWGARKRTTSYPSTTSESIRGWFCPHNSYNASIRLNGNPASVNITGLEVELPVVDEDKMITDVDIANSDMRFNVFVGVYEDGLMVKKVALQDVNGDDLKLTPITKKFAYSNKNNSANPIDYYDENDNIVLDNDSSIAVTDGCGFAAFDAYFPSDEELYMNLGSRYSINYFAEPFDGTMRLEYINSYTGSNPKVASTKTTADFGAERLTKIVTRISTLTEAAKLDLTFLCNEDTLPHKATDEVNIKDSIAQTTEDTIYDVLIRIAKRFNCGLFYEYDAVNAENVLRIDPLHVVRSGTQDIDSLIDDRKSFKISVGGSKYKTLRLKNKDYSGYFDKVANQEDPMGSTTQVINEEGTEEAEIELDSSVFYKSVCGGVNYERPQNLDSGAFGELELGLTKNLFSTNENVGFRFAYVNPPAYATWILHPYIQWATTLTGSQKTEVQTLYLRGTIGKGELANTHFVFNGELTHVNSAGYDLRAEDENGNTTDYYDLYSAGESLKLANNALVEFDMVVSTGDLADLDFFAQVLTAASITPSDIYVKSAEGEVHGDYAYLTITGLIV